MDVNAPTCEICGKKFSRKGRSKVVKTCSLSCRRESQARRMSTLRNRSGQTDCRLIQAPSTSRIAAMYSGVDTSLKCERREAISDNH